MLTWSIGNSVGGSTDTALIDVLARRPFFDGKNRGQLNGIVACLFCSNLSYSSTRPGSNLLMGKPLDVAI